uniref:Reverse transcriptase domain-containing protein n=1 Tax=Tanacetum cinerariifolium TaxID=118510 RepID=A0A699JNY6_TANCI|nr:hypothetical protein [Tanacetum cinerariifolium]
MSSDFNLIHNEDLDSTSKNDRFDTESYLLESLLNRDTLMASFPKINSLLDVFSGELITIPPRIVNSEHEEYISLIESDSLREEIDIFLAPDDSMPPGIENDDYDSKGVILFLEELLSNDSLSLPKNESFHFDVSSSPRPHAKPQDDDGIYFDDEPITRILTNKVVGDISKHCVLIPKLLLTQPTLCPVIDTLLQFSSKNKDKVHLLSHRAFKAFNLFSESPMMIYGGNIPILDVPFVHFYPP